MSYRKYKGWITSKYYVSCLVRSESFSLLLSHVVGLWLRLFQKNCSVSISPQFIDLHIPNTVVPRYKHWSEGNNVRQLQLSIKFKFINLFQCLWQIDRKLDHVCISLSVFSLRFFSRNKLTRQLVGDNVLRFFDRNIYSFENVKFHSLANRNVNPKNVFLISPFLCFMKEFLFDVPLITTRKENIT